MACANRRSWHRARRGAVALVPVPLCHRAAAMIRAETVIVGGGPAGAGRAGGLPALVPTAGWFRGPPNRIHKGAGDSLGVETKPQLNGWGAIPRPPAGGRAGQG